MKKSTAKLRVVASNEITQDQPLFATNPAAALPLLGLIGQAQLSIEDLLGRVSRELIEQLLLMSAQSVAGTKHPGRAVGQVRWHGSQCGQVSIGQAKLKVRRPRLRDGTGEVEVPAYASLKGEQALQQRIADILICNVSTRKYARVVRKSADALGISKSAVSRQFVKQSAQALEQLMQRSFAELDLVAIFMDGIIVGGHHILAALGVDATGHKHLLGLASGSSENAKVVRDLLVRLREQGVDMGLERLWVIDGSKALRSAIQEVCGDSAKVQRCRIHKIRNVTQRLPKDRRDQVRWLMSAAFKLGAQGGRDKLKALSRDLLAQYPDAAASVLEGINEMFTITELGVTGELARTLATTNLIESPNSVVRRVSGRVSNYKDAHMAMRWTAAGFLEGEQSFRRIRGHAQLKTLITALRKPLDQSAQLAA